MTPSASASASASVRVRVRRRRLLPAVLALALAGCVGADIDRSLATTNAQAQAFTDGRLRLDRTDGERAAARAAAGELLRAPLGQQQAVQLALVNDPALQALVAQRWADGARASQTARIANPVFGFSRMRTGGELEFERVLAFGLLDLVTLPLRHRVATRLVERNQAQLTADVVARVTQVRQAWVQAVAAGQMLQYARQVQESAEAGAELARRMQSVGNFNRLARARQQLFYADATTQLAIAQHAALAAREALVRSLGLSDEQARAMTLPDRLPDLPASPRAPEEVGRAAGERRLDVQIARSALAAAASAQGLALVESLTDIELGVVRKTVFDDDAGTRSIGRGVEVSVRLPLFDWGAATRAAMNAQTLAALNGMEAVMRAAGSTLREHYSAYRTAYDIAKHLRDEVVPLRESIAEENLLRYNGMLIGVFELLADSREQVRSVTAAIEAARQFWVADAALAASVIGRPVVTTIGPAGTNEQAGGDAAH
ncbi:MAG: TolC family protein [Lautropia sp.]